MADFFDRKLRLVILAVILSSTVAVGAGTETDKLDKQQIVGRVARDWIKVGIAQYERSFYEQAGQSFLQACNNRQYLTAGDIEKLSWYLGKIDEAEIRRKGMLAHIETADQLAGLGQVIKARAHLEKVRGSAFLSQLERERIAKALDRLAEQLNEQKREVAELYNRSVELYQAGQLEDARWGFIKVAGSGLLTASASMTPEDYLMKMREVPGGELKSFSSTETGPTANIPEATIAEAGDQLLSVRPKSSLDSAPQKIEHFSSTAVFDTAQVVIDESRYVEAINRKRNILRSYRCAVSADTVAKARKYMSEGKFYKAKEAVESAQRSISKNRRHLGNELFRHYKNELRRIAVRIEAGRAKWLGAGPK